MRLTISPGSLWLGYEATHTKELQALLPDHLTLARGVKLFGKETPMSPRLLFNAYHVRSPWMQGHRVDVQTLARDRCTGTLHLVVLDCVSDTFTWDPVQGVRGANARVVHRQRRTSQSEAPFGPLVVRELYRDTPCLQVSGRVGTSDVVPDERFVVEANRVCYFGNVDTGYHMTFDEQAVMAPVRRLRDVNASNTLWEHYRRSRPSHAFVHTRSMTFDVSVPDLWYV